MLTEITLESGCKSTTFYNTNQIFQKENAKKSMFFISLLDKSRAFYITPIYIIYREQKTRKILLETKKAEGLK